jgi:hypothetical protein
MGRRLTSRCSRPLRARDRWHFGSSCGALAAAECQSVRPQYQSLIRAKSERRVLSVRFDSPSTFSIFPAYAMILPRPDRDRPAMSQQRPIIARPAATPAWTRLTFLPYDHLIIVSPVPLDVARQRFQALINSQPQPKPFDVLFVGFPGSRQAPYYRGTFHDDYVQLTGPYGYRTWEFTIDGHLSLNQHGTSFDVVIRLDGLYGCAFILVGFLCVPVVIGLFTSWWFGVVAAGIVLLFMAMMIGILQDALVNVRDGLVDLLAPVPRFHREP